MYVATNPAEAALFGRDLLGVHRVRPLAPIRPDEGFQSTFHGVLIRDVTLGYLDYSMDVAVEVQELTEDYIVFVPAAGSSTMIADAGSPHPTEVDLTPVMAGLPMPRRAMKLTCAADAAHLVVRIARAALETHLSRLLGRTLEQPLTFEPAFDLAVGSASRWNFAVQMLHAELYEPSSLLHSGTGLGQLEEFVMSSLLYTQPSNYTELLTQSVGPEHRAVRSARDFIERNLTAELDVGDIARAAGVSVRTLQSLFRSDLQQSPTNYVKDLRLERVRAELADATPTGSVTVTDVAAHWGFTHLGRFAALYKARFGESPSQTLRS